METTLKATVAYDGAPFSGWQRQPTERTVQGEIEAALSRIANQPVAIQGAGRTDAGVHAIGQVFSCRWPGPFPERLRHALSKMLGPEIRITALEVAPESFNARFSARAKRYVYSIDNNREAHPFAARYAWHVPYALDLSLMQSLIPELEGEHDFAAFQSTGSQMQSTVRTIYSIRIAADAWLHPRGAQHLWRIEFFGNGFLYKMVRNLTGTLIEIGRGRFPADFIRERLAAGGSFRGHCAPPHGLLLDRVYYEDFEAPPKRENAPQPEPQRAP